MSQEIPNSDITTVKVAKGDTKAREMMAEGWVKIGDPHYVDYGDGSGEYHFPLGWPKTAGPTPTVYPD